MANYDAEFVKVKGTAKLTVSILITLSDGATKALVLKEGDHVSNLTYVENGETHTITGDVRVINYTVKPAKTSVGEVTCVHDTTSDFSSRVSATSLVVDCSNVYHSDIRVVPVSAIRDFDSMESSELVVTNAKFLSDTQVSFVCNVEPVAAIWNGKAVALESVGDGDSIYTITVDTMRAANTLVVVTGSSRDSVMLAGKMPTVYQPNDLTDALNTLVDAFNDTYLDTFTEPDVEVPDEEFYLAVAEGVTGTETVVVNSKKYKSEGSISLDIGTGGFVNKCIFKIEDGKLLLAAPVMYALADENGEIDVTVNGFDLIVSINTLPGSLSVDPETVSVTGEKYDTKHTVSIELSGDLTEERQDKLGYVTATLVDNGGNVIPEGSILYELKNYADGNTADLYRISKVTSEPIELSSDISDTLVTEEASTKINYVFRAPIAGYGKLSVTTVETVANRKGTYTVSQSEDGANFNSLADAIKTLEPNDVVVLTSGIYTEPLELTKPMSIIGSGSDSVIKAPLSISLNGEETGKVLIDDVAFNEIASAEGTDGTKTGSSGACIKVSGNVDLSMTGVEISDVKNFYTVVELNTSGSAVIKNCKVGDCDSYHFLETVYDKNANPAPNNLLIENCEFGKFNHNIINFYSVEEGATITIRDCKFKRSANAVRLSNITDAHATFNFVNLEYAETDNPPEDGLLIMQDALGTEDFGKFTLSFKSVAYAPEGGKRIVFTDKDMVDAGQLWYIYKNNGEYTKELPKVTYTIAQ